MKLFIRLILLITSVVLLITSALIIYQRQADNSTFWFLTSAREGNQDYYLITAPDGKGRHIVDSEPLGLRGNWFVEWSPDGRYLFYREVADQQGTSERLYAYDLVEGESRLLVETAPPVDAIRMRLSASGDHYAVLVNGVTERQVHTVNLPSLAVHSQIVTPDAITALRWIPDGDWLYVSTSAGDAYRVDPSATQPEPLSSRFAVTSNRIYSPNKQAYVTYDGTEITLHHVDAGETLIPAPGNLTPINWLTADRLLLVEKKSSDDGVSVSFGLSRMNIDGTQFVSLTDELDLNMMVYLQDTVITPDGRYIFVPVINVDTPRVGPESSVNVYRIDVETGETDLFLEDVISTIGEAPTRIPVSWETPNGFLMTTDGQWIIWSQIRDGVASIWRTGLDGTKRQQLFRFPTTTDVQLALSPDEQHILATYSERHPELRFERKIARISIADGKTQIASLQDARIVTHSPLFERNFSGALLLVAAFVLLAGGVVLIRYRQLKRNVARVKAIGDTLTQAHTRLEARPH